MKTLNYAVLFVLVLSFGFVSFGCGESDSPTAPSATTMAEALSYVPVNAARTMPASFDVRTLQPGTGDDNDGFNAYDFEASYDGSMLTLALIEDQMTAMREASKPHRNRRITVGVCPSEPHHRLQACGDPIWQGSMQLAGRLELDPIPLASCEGWIVVNAAELSDDIYDGWRNAPCPATDGDPVGSDGTGDEWPDYPEPESGLAPASIDGWQVQLCTGICDGRSGTSEFVSCHDGSDPSEHFFSAWGLSFDEHYGQLERWEYRAHEDRGFIDAYGFSHLRKLELVMTFTSETTGTYSAQAFGASTGCRDYDFRGSFIPFE